jgi:hypothetical protein
MRDRLEADRERNMAFLAEVARGQLSSRTLRDQAARVLKGHGQAHRLK